ncbi:MAG: proline dehydrogenase family protein, partial [Desulfobacterales bacterium]|nr:proline dehydrogenase family protein [Desulfobacterales bacterium]
MSLFNFAVSKTIMHVPSPIVRYFAKDYVAGKDITNAVEVCRDLESKGIESTLDILGEYIVQKEQALPFKDECIKILKTIHKLGLKSNLSIKPSQMGLKLDYDFALQNLRDVVAEAAALDGFVRIDMEDVDCNEPTIKIYQILRKEFPGHVGVALQSYMRNAMDHLELLKDEPLNIRLVKGIFIVSRQQAWKDPELVTRNYVQLLERMFELGAYVGIATHDEVLYYEAQ